MKAEQNGREQVESMARLSGYQPDTLAGLKVGDAVRLPNIETTFEVIAVSDPVLTLRAPSGREVKAGWRACAKVRTRADMEVNQ